MQTSEYIDRRNSAKLSHLPPGERTVQLNSIIVTTSIKLLPL